MKNKLQPLALFIGLLFSTGSCIDEEVGPHPFSEIQNFQNAFSPEAFNDDVIKDKLTVHWDNFNIEQDQENNRDIYEFNTSLKGNNTLKNGEHTLVFTYKLLAFRDDEGNPAFELLKFLAEDQQTLQQISYFNSASFSGTLYHYNLKGENTLIKAYKDGVLINEFADKEKGHITAQSKAPETSCENGCYVLVFTDHYTDYYLSINGGMFSYAYSIFKGTTSEWVWISGGGSGGSAPNYHYHFDDPHGPAIGSDNHDDEMLPYNCTCSCEGNEDGWNNDLSENMEPKWGQLANKQEILDEINSIENFDTLSYEEQITALINHFEYNLMYDRDDNSNELVQIDNIDPNAPNLYSNDPDDVLPVSKDVNKYIYTEVGGWIDFHHVFKIFGWATQNGPFAALTQGELGEMWQSLMDNHSAYSYEDLPSNLLGVGMYVRFSQSLANGQITWQEAVSTALDEIGWKEPEEAPNFSYIPYILDEHYPQNFTYTPLLGEALRDYHKQKFCERPKDQQDKIIEAHEKFSR